MLHELPESRRRRRRSTRGLVTSVVLHGALIVVVVVGTAGGTPAPEEPPIERLTIYHAPPPAPASPRAPAPPRDASTPNPVQPTVPTPALPAPIEVPELIPPPGAPTLAPDFFEQRALGAGSGASSGGAADGTPGGTGAAPADGIWASHLVEREVVPLGGAAPRYPETLRRAGVAGAVVAEFVVDTTGRVEAATVRLSGGAHPLFEAAVRQALRGMRFRPAAAGGQVVRQLVRQPFVFALQR